MLYYFHSCLRQGLFGTSDYSVVNEWNSHGILEPVLVNAVNNETDCRLNQFFLLSIMTRPAAPRLIASRDSVSLGPGKRWPFPYSAPPLCCQCCDCLIDALILADCYTCENRRSQANRFLATHNVQTTPGQGGAQLQSQRRARPSAGCVNVAKVANGFSQRFRNDG
jgi:hypothetical protein